ncbi:MAG: hypothetical protein IJW70_00170 [Clostridia bacterium]|nr:hypothetical protein [Clostridia bacterium]
MKIPNSNQIRWGMCLIIGGTLFSAVAASLTICNLGSILSLFLESGGELDFVAIFSQLQDARIVPHLLLPLLLFAAYTALLFLVPPKGTRRAVRVTLYVLAGLVLLLVCFAISLLLTRVNDVRFIDLLRALIPMPGSL